MKYKVLRDTVATGQVCRVGEVIDLNESDAKELMATGRVAPHDEETPAVDRAIGLDEETKPKRRTRKTKVR
jgi:hypothetical protein